MKYNLINKEIKENYVNELLKERGVEDLDKFFNPSMEYISNPKKLENIEAGGKLLLDTLKDSSKRILIVVDSDTDGYTSSTIIYQYIKKINKEIALDYILHKGKQHGLSDLIDEILDEKRPHYDLIILPDSSSSDFEFHERLKEFGTKCLVLDHHDAEPPYSNNAVIINNQLSPNYKNKELTGAGVTWQFCRYLDSITDGESFANSLIDLAALGVTGDMGSVLDLENRSIIYYGFHNIKNIFFNALREKQAYSMNGETNPITVAFYIVPLINAMIRVGTSDEKERLFLAFINGKELVECHKRGAKGTLEEVAIESARECTNARAKQNRILDKAVEELEIKISKYDLLENKILFVRLDTEDFPPELNGLVAMKLAARYKKPTIVARLNNAGEDKGSIRGLNDSELEDFKGFLLDSGYFDFVQGHPNAAGCAIVDDKLSAFHKYANQKLENINFNENYYDVNFERIAADKDLEDLISDIGMHDGIWGQHNNEPLIYVKDLNVTKDDIRIMGKNQDTLKIEKFGISYLKFRATDMIQELAKYPEIKLEIVGRANLNEWCGNVTCQIFINDYEIKNGELSF